MVSRAVGSTRSVDPLERGSALPLGLFVPSCQLSVTYVPMSAEAADGASTPAPDENADENTVADRIGAAAARLTASERRVAEVVLDDLKIVAFGTVAQL